VEDRKTIFNLDEIIARCIKEAKTMGYIDDKATCIVGEGIEEKAPVPPLLVNEHDFIKHLSRTIIGELYEFEIIRRITPIFRENRALTHDFLLFGEAFELFYDKQIQDLQLHGMRFEPEGGSS
jgi:hypothetical protein